MTDNEAHPSRRHPAHHPLVETGNRAILVFLTVCTKDRKPILATAAAHDAIRRAWEGARDWRVGRYVVMPDHVHLFCAPGRVDYPPLAAWVKYWKALASRGWPVPAQQPLWQVDFWDTQLRRGDNYGEKWEYVRRNPVRAKLVASPEDWPYQGAMDVLMWHDA